MLQFLTKTLQKNKFFPVKILKKTLRYSLLGFFFSENPIFQGVRHNFCIDLFSTVLFFSFFFNFFLNILSHSKNNLPLF